MTALGYSWDTVHEEASRLDHVISEELEMRIAAVMGDPQRDPQVSLSRTLELEMPIDSSRPLSTLKPHQRATISLVRTDDPALLRYFESIGITIGVEVEVLSSSPFDQTLVLQVPGHEPKTLGSVITRQVFVVMH